MKKDNYIIVTAPTIYNHSLVKSIQKKGLKAISFPVIETIVYDNPGFDSIFKNIYSFDYIVLPSKTAINSFLKQVESRNIVLEQIKSTFVAIGKDYEFLGQNNFKKILKPSEPSTQGIVHLLSQRAKNKNILVFIPKVQVISEPPIIPELLNNLSKFCHLTSVEAYLTRPVLTIPLAVSSILFQNKYELIAISSGGEAAAIKFLFPDNYKDLKIACFGPYTNKTAVNEGFKPLFTGTNFSSFSDFSNEIYTYLNNTK